MPACTDIPISWLRLERLAIGELEPTEAGAVRAHLAGCEACRAGLGAIETDRRRLRPLRLPEAQPRRQRRRWALSVGLAAAAAAALLLLWRDGGGDELPGRRVGIKGGGEMVIGLVRERGGAIDRDPASFRDGDRFKVSLTCTRAGEARADVVVIQGRQLFRPLGPAPRLHCTNNTLIPGAFRVTGDEPIAICVALDPPRPLALNRLEGAACTTLEASRGR
jgi:hypothetical protein